MQACAHVFAIISFFRNAINEHNLHKPVRTRVSGARVFVCLLENANRSRRGCMLLSTSHAARYFCKYFVIEIDGHVTGVREREKRKRRAKKNTHLHRCPICPTGAGGFFTQCSAVAAVLRFKNSRNVSRASENHPHKSTRKPVVRFLANC